MVVNDHDSDVCGLAAYCALHTVILRIGARFSFELSGVSVLPVDLRGRWVPDSLVG